MKNACLSKYWAEILLFGIIGFSGFLNLWNLWNEGFAITYYAAAVRSMLANPSVTFFNSFDAVGFVTVDKPPVGIWAQAASAAVFGFNSWSVLLPQALAGIGSVAIIYFIVERPFGKPAGLIAAFALATTPVFVSTSRSGTMDTQMIFVILLAVLIALKAARDHSFWYLVLSVVLVGVGFNIKMIQAFVVVPAIIAVYLFGAALPVRQKLLHILVALLVLAAVSMSWAVAIDSIPVDQRPYIGTSGDNTVLGLIVGHNGAEAFEGANVVPGVNEPPGLFRLFSPGLDIQLSWLLPFALIGLCAWWRRPASVSMTGFRDSGFFSEKGLTLIALCLWLLPGLLYFSFTMGNWSWYYLATIAPPLAGLVGISAVAMYHEYRTDLWMGWLLVVAVLVTGLMEAWKEYQMFVYSPMGYGFLLAVDLAGCICCAGILVWLRTKNVQGTGMHSVTIACIAVAVLFVAPVVWSCAPLTNSPEPLMRGPLQGQAGTHLSAFLVSHAGNYTFLVAVPSGEVIGSTLIVDTGKPVMALGGFFGTDQILTAGKLPGLIRNGTVRYFLIPFSNSSLISLPSGDRNIGGNTAIYTWVTDHCTVIPASEWSGSEDTLLSAQYALYDCAGAV